MLWPVSSNNRFFPIQSNGKCCPAHPPNVFNLLIVIYYIKSRYSFSTNGMKKLYQILDILINEEKSII